MRKIVEFINKGLVVFFLAGSIWLLPLLTFAQGDAGGPQCGDGDPTVVEPCPLDTWVFVLAAVVLVFAVIHLQLKQRINKPNLITPQPV
jgi:hypothetical protein